MNPDLSQFAEVIVDTLSAFYLVIIFVAPVFLGFLCFESFAIYKRNKFLKEKHDEARLLELKLPREMLKSPLAMELFLASIYQTSGETTFLDTLFKGKTRPIFSLEICSFEGEVRFFIWTWEFWRPIVSSHLYAQFPEIEVEEVKDYSAGVHYEPGKNEVFATEYQLSKPGFYPIKTYVDFGLDKDPKEEFKIDPMVSFIEYISNIGKGEQIWFQFILRSHKAGKMDPNHFKGKEDWVGPAREEIKKLKSKDIQEAGEIKISGASLSKGEKDVIDSIERNISKLAFDCVIRSIYIADKDKFKPINIVGLIGVFRQYNAPHMNSFSVVGSHITAFDYPWQDFRDMRLKARKHHLMHAYNERAAFHVPHRGHYFTINTEGLATIYHFPGQVAKTPTLTRIGAKKAEPPSNLPI
jgi:hypothetical protein